MDLGQSYHGGWGTWKSAIPSARILNSVVLMVMLIEEATIGEL